MATITSKPETKPAWRWQFSLRMMLVLLVLAATGLATFIWWTKPQDELHIQLTADGHVRLAGKLVPRAALVEELEKLRIEKVNAGVSSVDVKVHVHLARDACYRDFLNVVQACGEHSFELFRFHINGEIFRWRIPSDGRDVFSRPSILFSEVRLDADSKGQLALVWLNNQRLGETDSIQDLHEPLIVDRWRVLLLADDHLTCEDLFRLISGTKHKPWSGAPQRPMIYPVSNYKNPPFRHADDPVNLESIFDEAWSESEWGTRKE